MTWSWLASRAAQPNSFPELLAGPILRHRMMLKPEADLEGVTPDQVVTEVLAGIAVPK